MYICIYVLIDIDLADRAGGSETLWSAGRFHGNGADIDIDIDIDIDL